MIIHLLRLNSGEQVISEVVSSDSDYTDLKNPIGLVPTPDGNLNFVPWCPLSSKDAVLRVREASIVYTTTPNEELIRNYKEIFSSIITPQNAGKIIT